MSNLIKWVWGIFLFSALIPTGLVSQTFELTSDGAWCWFSDPRAIVLDNGEILTGWVTKDGSVEMTQFTPNQTEPSLITLFPKMQVDDHNNPAFSQMPNGSVISTYTWHSSPKGIVYHLFEQPQDQISNPTATIIRPGLEKLEDFPRETFTYANPFYLKDEEALYVFGRWIGYKPNLIRSLDGGKTWDVHKVVISAEPFDPGNRPYVKYASNGKDRIDLIFTDGHPRNEPLNGVYHCYYQSGHFYRSDGSTICGLDELPFTPDQATLVYQPKAKEGRAWLADLTVDEAGQPVILYTRHPTEEDHRYQYAYYDKDRHQWIDHEIVKAGKWFPQTQPGKVEREPHYHGNLTLHPSKPGVVYLSRQIDGIFEIERWITSDGGDSWKHSAITSESKFDNVRPYVPRGLSANEPEVVLWMRNKKYIHYTDYDTSILYHIE